MQKKIKTAFFSVYYKDGLLDLIRELHTQGVVIYSTGGTAEFITSAGFPVVTVEELTGFPPILGGRVKTLHPKVFGGILARHDNNEDLQTLTNHGIPLFDVVIVNLYPFEESVQLKKTHPEIIEKIDIGGVSLIRAAAKNYEHVLSISNEAQYDKLVQIIKTGYSTTEERLAFSARAFKTASAYDTVIAEYLENLL